jgi:hypothetical protein
MSRTTVLATTSGSYWTGLQKMYVVLDKVKPSISSLKGVNLAAARPTTIQAAKCSFRVIE